MSGQELRYAINLGVVGKYLGQLCLIQGVLAVVPLAVAVVTAQWAFVLRAVAVIIVLAGSGALLVRIRVSREVQFNEAMVIVAAAFVLAAMMMAIPMTATGLGPVDAFFEAVSGVTTTGLSVVGDPTGKPFVFLFSRAWMQWYGGLGIVVLSLALVMRPGINAHRISMAQLGPIATGTRAHALRTCAVYAVLSGGGLLLLLLCGIDVKSALVHTMTSVSTGGFSTTADSLAGLDNWMQVSAVLVLSFLGAVSFAVYYHSVRQHSCRHFLLDPEVQALTVLTLLASAAVVGSLHYLQGAAWDDAVPHGTALAVSAQTTTGYSTVTVADQPAVVKAILIVCMFTGGALGSTAGGIKMLRLLLVGKAILVVLRQTSMPQHAVLVPRLRGQRIEPEAIHDAVLVVVLFLTANIVSWLIFLAAGYAPLDAMFDVVSATGTVGLSTGVTGAALPAGLKLLLCMNMLLGRLEMVALLILFYPPTWLGRRRERQ